MKRALLGFALAAMFVATPLATNTAGAAAPSKTTITLTCDKNIDAQVTLTLQTQLGADLGTVTKADLNCGPDSASGNSRIRLVVTTTEAADAVSVTQFDVSSGGILGSCAGSSTLPAKINCAPLGNTAAGLVVR
jgi:hypothetical protein